MNATQKHSWLYTNTWDVLNTTCKRWANITLETQTEKGEEEEEEEKKKNIKKKKAYAKYNNSGGAKNKVMRQEWVQK